MVWEVCEYVCLCVRQEEKVRLWFSSKTGKCWSKLTSQIPDSWIQRWPNFTQCRCVIYAFMSLLTVCVSVYVCVRQQQANVVVLLSKEVIRGELLWRYNYISGFFSCSGCVFPGGLFFLPFTDSCEELRLTHLTMFRQRRTAPTGRGRSLVCPMMSVFGEDECVGLVGGLDESSKGKEECMCGGGNTRSPTEMLNSITQWKREEDSLQGWRKRSTFNLGAN